MDADETAVVFIVEYYELLQSARAQLAFAYAEGARLFLQRATSTKSTSSNFHTVVPAGHRTILTCSGQVMDGFLHVHVQSTLAMGEKVELLDEAFTCRVSERVILILYHSIHVNPILANAPPPPAAPKPAPPKPKIDPVEVASPARIDRRSGALVRNLSYGLPPKDIIPILVEKFGDITKFSQDRGRLAVEFSEKDANAKAVCAGPFEWEGRPVRITWIPRNFAWDEPQGDRHRRLADRSP
jgi:hypothetical protein